MRKYPVPNLRRDLLISVVLLVASLAAVVPHAAMVAIALAAFVVLMVLRVTVLSRVGRVQRHAGERESVSARGRNKRPVLAAAA